jgi:hypothetical protein
MGKLREISDKVSEYTDKAGIANPIEVVDESLGGQTRQESKARRDAAKEKVVKETPQPTKKMATGGSASSRADGCAIRGKTRA